jgi:hypothetical protein
MFHIHKELLSYWISLLSSTNSLKERFSNFVMSPSKIVHNLYDPSLNKADVVTVVNARKIQHYLLAGT